jgi:hypothetical protein
LRGHNDNWTRIADRRGGRRRSSERFRSRGCRGVCGDDEIVEGDVERTTGLIFTELQNADWVSAKIVGKADFVDFDPVDPDRYLTLRIGLVTDANTDLKRHPGILWDFDRTADARADDIITHAEFSIFPDEDGQDGLIVRCPKPEQPK